MQDRRRSSAQPPRPAPGPRVAPQSGGAGAPTQAAGGQLGARVRARVVDTPAVPTARGVQMPWDRWEAWETIVQTMRDEFAVVLEQHQDKTKADFEDENIFYELVATRMRQHAPRFGVPEHEFKDLQRHLYNELMGLGAITLYLQAPNVEDILLDSYSCLDIIQRGEKIRISPTPFRSDEEVFQWLQNAVFAPINKEFNRSNPLENAILKDGSRLFAFTQPISPYTGFVIRKHQKEVFQTGEDYMRTGVAPPEFFAELDAWVKGHRNIVISGATGSGKTTMTNFAASLVPHTERLVTLEDTPELQIIHPRVKAMYTYEHGSRAGSSESDRDISMRDLLRSALRMRPDRIIVGEVRDRETFDMLDALNTGHAGSFTTLHSNSPVDAITRLQTMAIRASVDFPVDALRDLIASVIDIVVQIKYLPDSGERRVVAVEQVLYAPHYHEQPEVWKQARPLYENLRMRVLWRWDDEQERLAKQDELAVPDHD